MTIAAVPIGAAVLDVPRRGDVLVIKERVGNLTRRAVPWHDPASRLRGSGGPQVHNTRSRKSSPTEWLTGTPLPRRKAVMGFIGLGLGLGVFRLADYQVVEADKLRERADARRLLAQTLYAKRGTIYDRNGNVLASSVECRNIAVNPQLVEDVDKTVSALVKATGIDKKDLPQAR